MGLCIGVMTICSYAFTPSIQGLGCKVVPSIFKFKYKVLQTKFYVIKSVPLDQRFLLYKKLICA